MGGGNQMIVYMRKGTLKTSKSHIITNISQSYLICSFNYAYVLKEPDAEINLFGMSYLNKVNVNERKRKLC